jgi:hypothetical protein
VCLQCLSSAWLHDCPMKGDGERSVRLHRTVLILLPSCQPSRIVILLLLYATTTKLECVSPYLFHIACPLGRLGSPRKNSYQTGAVWVRVRERENRPAATLLDLSCRTHALLLCICYLSGLCVSLSHMLAMLHSWSSDSVMTLSCSAPV